MLKLNIVIVYDKNEENILMCFRTKDPYKGLYNLVGGKIEAGETDLEGAYRELEEETGITQADIILTRLMDFEYYMNEIELQVFVGRLNKAVTLREEKHPLSWIDANSDFYDPQKYAGEGNIGHMVEQIKIHKDKVLK